MSFEEAIFLFFVIIAVVSFVVTFNAQSKRREELMMLSTQLGLGFSILDPFNIPTTYRHTDWLTKGRNQKAYNVLYGRVDDYDVKAFDFSYETGDGGKHRSVHRLSCVILDTQDYCPSLLVRPEGLLDHMSGALGFQDIDFESEEFSRKFFVKSTDKKFAYDLIHPRMMQLFLSEPKWTLQIKGRSIIVYTGSLLRPAEFAQGINFIRGFLGLFPEYLRKELHGSQEAT